MITREEILPIGTFRKAHGKRGELCLSSKTDILEFITPQFVVVCIDGINVPFVVTSFRPHGNDYLLELEDIDTEQKARRLLSLPVSLLRREMPEGYEEQVPIEHLVGFQVYDTHHQLLGRIKDIDDQTQNTLIMLDDGRVLPLHEDLIEQLSIEDRQIVMDVPEGI